MSDMSNMSDIQPTVVKCLLGLYADEWLAVYQYSVQSDFCRMLLSDSRITQKRYNEVTKELDQHRNEEFNHAKLLVPELIRYQSGPVSHIDKLSTFANDPFVIPSNDVTNILNQSINAEKNAIAAYSKALELAKEINDSKLFDLFSFIIEQENEHKNDLQILLPSLS